MPRSLASLSSLLLPALLLVACEDTGGPCEEYVDYMCACHTDDDGCGDLQTIYEDADADLQDECVIALDEQEDADLESGFECGTDTGDTGEV